MRDTQGRLRNAQGTVMQALAAAYQLGMDDHRICGVVVEITLWAKLGDRELPEFCWRVSSGFSFGGAANLAIWWGT